MSSGQNTSLSLACIDTSKPELFFEFCFDPDHLNPLLPLISLRNSSLSLFVSVRIELCSEGQYSDSKPSLSGTESKCSRSSKIIIRLYHRNIQGVYETR